MLITQMSFSDKGKLFKFASVLGFNGLLEQVQHDSKFFIMVLLILHFISLFVKIVYHIRGHHEVL